MSPARRPAAEPGPWVKPVPTEHAWTVARLLEAGAGLAGKTITCEVSLGILGFNAHFGTPPNPAAPGCLPGGSSSGSASVVAAGAVRCGVGDGFRRLRAGAGQPLRPLRVAADAWAHPLRRRLRTGAELRYRRLVRPRCHHLRPRCRGAAAGGAAGAGPARAAGGGGCLRLGRPGGGRGAGFRRRAARRAAWRDAKHFDRRSGRARHRGSQRGILQRAESYATFRPAWRRPIRASASTSPATWRSPR